MSVSPKSRAELDGILAASRMVDSVLRSMTFERLLAGGWRALVRVEPERDNEDRPTTDGTCRVVVRVRHPSPLDSGHFADVASAEAIRDLLALRSELDAWESGEGPWPSVIEPARNGHAVNEGGRR